MNIALLTKDVIGHRVVSNHINDKQHRTLYLTDDGIVELIKAHGEFKTIKAVNDPSPGQVEQFMAYFGKGKRKVAGSPDFPGCRGGVEKFKLSFGQQTGQMATVAVGYYHNVLSLFLVCSSSSVLHPYVFPLHCFDRTLNSWPQTVTKSSSRVTNPTRSGSVSNCTTTNTGSLL